MPLKLDDTILSGIQAKSIEAYIFLSSLPNDNLIHLKFSNQAPLAYLKDGLNFKIRP